MGLVEEYGNYCYEKFATTLLLTLLPNVTKLVMSSRDHADQSDTLLWELLWCIVDRAKRNDSSAGSLSSLSKLDSLTLYSLASTPFLCMEGLRRFNAHDIYSCTEFLTPRRLSFKQPSNTNFETNLTTLTFRKSYFGDVQLKMFLTKLPQLRKLELTEVEYPGMRELSEGEGFVAVIGDSVGDRLEELSLDLGYAEGGIKSMKAFQKLKVLTLQFELFEAFAWYNLGRARRSGDHELEEWELLSGILPPTIETIKIVITKPLEEANYLKSFLSDIDQYEHGKLPKLREITIYNAVARMPRLLKRKIKYRRSWDALKWLCSCKKINWVN